MDRSNFTAELCQHRNNTVAVPGFSCPNPLTRPFDTETDSDPDPDLASPLTFSADLRLESTDNGVHLSPPQRKPEAGPWPHPVPWPGRKRHRASAPLREALRIRRDRARCRSIQSGSGPYHCSIRRLSRQSLQGARAWRQVSMKISRSPCCWMKGNRCVEGGCRV